MRKSSMIIILVLAVFMCSTSMAMASSVIIDSMIYTSVNSSTAYGGFIAPSNTSWDSGANKINIVDWLLTYGGNHSYTYVTTGTWFSDGASSVILAEIAGNAHTNTFGYYTESGRTQLFSGGASTNATANFTLDPARIFGFYLGVSGGTFYYTDNSLQAAIFKIDDDINKYIIGFEDLAYAYSDKDFQDMIVSATINKAVPTPAPAPVPEPATMLLLGSGLLSLAGFRRKFKK